MESPWYSEMKASMVLSWAGIVASLVGLVGLLSLREDLILGQLVGPLFSYAGLAIVGAARRRYSKSEGDPPPKNVMITAVASTLFTTLLFLGITSYCAWALTAP